jgi:TolB protein
MRRTVSVCAIVLISVATPLPARATFPGTNGRIAFYDFLEFFGPPDVSAQIYTVAPDGSDRQQLTTGRRDKTDPAWSADGSKIVVVDADGQNPVIVATFANDRYASEPAWSPDGTRLAFCTSRGFAVERIWVVNSDGTGLARLTPAGHQDCEPDWSPDGSWIAFVEELADDSNGLSVMSPDGSGRTLLFAGGRNHWPSWSPDGTSLVYSHARADAQRTEYDIVSIDVATLVRSPLTDTPRRSEWTPVFSPDGTEVAFSRSRLFGPADLWTMGSDGTDPVRISDSDADEFQLSWQAV